MSDTQASQSNGYIPVMVKPLGSEVLDEFQEQTIHVHLLNPGETTAQELHVDAIYQGGKGLSRQLETALRLLRQADDHLEVALSEANAGHRVTADDSIYAVKALLPELFCCRGISNGFGTLIGSLLCVFENLRGQEASKEQRTAIHSCIKLLRSRPLLDEDTADKQVELLEETGLNPDPNGLPELVKALIDDDE